MHAVTDTDTDTCRHMWVRIDNSKWYYSYGAISGIVLVDKGVKVSLKDAVPITINTSNKYKQTGTDIVTKAGPNPQIRWKSLLQVKRIIFFFCWSRGWNTISCTIIIKIHTWFVLSSIVDL